MKILFQGHFLKKRDFELFLNFAALWSHYLYIKIGPHHNVFLMYLFSAEFWRPKYIGLL